MTPAQILTQVISILTGGIVETATAMGTGISTAVTSLCFTGSGESQTISAFFTFVLIFAGVSLALSLFRWVVNLVGSFAQRNR